MLYKWEVPGPSKLLSISKSDSPKLSTSKSYPWGGEGPSSLSVIIKRLHPPALALGWTTHLFPPLDNQVLEGLLHVFITQ